MSFVSAPPQISHFLAERHESLWLRLSALHKDICAIAAKKPEAPVGNTERATVEGFICDCRPFLKKPADRLPGAGCRPNLFRARGAIGPGAGCVGGF